MRWPRDDDEMTDLIGDTAMRDGPQGAVDLIRRFLDDETGRPETIRRAELLVELGEHLTLVGDEVAAGEALRAAVADGGTSFVDARAWLLSWCLRNGRPDEAVDLGAQLRRSPEPLVHLTVGESYEEHGDLAAATRWFTAGLERAGHVRDIEMLAAARLRVRREQGFPPDEDDEMALEALAQRKRALRTPGPGPTRRRRDPRRDRRNGAGTPGRRRG